MYDNAQGGNDTLTAENSGANSFASLCGDAEDLYDSAQGGNDSLTAIDSGSGSYAVLYDDAYLMFDSAQGGNDILNGGDGNDTLYGDAGIYSPSSPGLITGGTDTLNGRAGNDELWGGPNDDTFVFDAGSSNDTINDFDQGNAAVGSSAPEHDVIDVSTYGFADWSALQANISDNGADNAVVDLSADDFIVLVGIHTAALDATDFII